MSPGSHTGETYMKKNLWEKEILELEKQMQSLTKKTRKTKKDDKLTKADWIELLNFWPMTIVVPIMLILILFGPWILS
tara:strand:+ start:681 stop:914 length:234 start_codon:yes stop_codon:yes gene_type:complete